MILSSFLSSFLFFFPSPWSNFIFFFSLLPHFRFYVLPHFRLYVLFTSLFFLSISLSCFFSFFCFLSFKKGFILFIFCQLTSLFFSFYNLPILLFIKGVCNQIKISVKISLSYFNFLLSHIQKAKFIAQPGLLYSFTLGKYMNPSPPPAMD